MRLSSSSSNNNSNCATASISTNANTRTCRYEYTSMVVSRSSHERKVLFRSQDDRMGTDKVSSNVIFRFDFEIMEFQLLGVLFPNERTMFTHTVINCIDKKKSVLVTQITTAATNTCSFTGKGNVGPSNTNVDTRALMSALHIEPKQRQQEAALRAATAATAATTSAQDVLEKLQQQQQQQRQDCCSSNKNVRDCYSSSSNKHKKTIAAATSTSKTIAATTTSKTTSAE